MVVRQEALPAAAEVEEVPPAEAADTASRNRTFDDKYRAVCPVFLYSSGKTSADPRDLSRGRNANFLSIL